MHIPVSASSITHGMKGSVARSRVPSEFEFHIKHRIFTVTMSRTILGIYLP